MLFPVLFTVAYWTTSYASPEPVMPISLLTATIAAAALLAVTEGAVALGWDAAKFAWMAVLSLPLMLARLFLGGIDPRTRLRAA